MAHPDAIAAAEGMVPIFKQVQSMLAQLETFRTTVLQDTENRKKQAEALQQQFRQAAAADAASQATPVDGATKVELDAPEELGGLAAPAAEAPLAAAAAACAVSLTFADARRRALCFRDSTSCIASLKR